MKKPIIKLITLIAAILIILAAIYFIINFFENRNSVKEGDYAWTDTADITIDGVGYKYRDDISTVLFMGIDQDGKVTKSESFDKGGQCDVIMVVVFDKVTNTSKVIQINRDTMTKVNVIDQDGMVLEDETAQIALAHAYGDGMENSCDNVVESVNYLMYDIHIDDYIALNMGGIGTLNNLAGGVTVTLDDDFSSVDPQMTEGSTIKLSDEQAEQYVRGRMNIGDGLNTSRMKRQRQYITALVDNFKNKINMNSSFVNEAYDALDDYVVTSMSRSDMTGFFTNMGGYEQEIIELEGSNDTSGEHVEFNIDDDALKQLVIDTFYKPVS